ncbi:hypothetical protein [Nitrosomonas sp. Nm34]|uniref:hypothetical protein n=1 Tax=Nitrosomonas sp. Nm34 TaxID=1881055 RepID=UPI0008E68150|nr:hypothetical protein [Nitrosomonas sp. Nm34]SFI76184.1 hypothetical protein SAMN05428978_103318 [Nitrosomonas sp. Nm34]
MDNSIPLVIGMAWYHSGDYDAILKIMIDSNHFPRSFDEWLVKAEREERRLKKAGYTVLRVFINPKTFPAWCKSRELNNDSRSLIEFANSIAIESKRRSH